MEALIGGLIFVTIAQFSLLWHRMGRLEQKIRDCLKNGYK